MIGGAHVGYNKQVDWWVVGVEGAVDPTLMSRGLSISAPVPVAAASGIGATGSGAIWSPLQASLRARAGFTLDRMLLYTAGGVAIGEFGSQSPALWHGRYARALLCRRPAIGDTRRLDRRRRRRIRRQSALVGERRIPLFGFRPYRRFARRDFDGRVLRRRSSSGSKRGAGRLKLQVRRRRSASAPRKILTSVHPFLRAGKGSVPTLEPSYRKGQPHETSNDAHFWGPDRDLACMEWRQQRGGESRRRHGVSGQRFGAAAGPAQGQTHPRGLCHRQGRRRDRLHRAVGGVSRCLGSRLRRIALRALYSW